MQIAPHLKRIVTTISEQAVVSIIAPTGSGKSVGIPAALAATGTRCFITVPTVTAARSLYNYQKYVDERVRVGYAAEGEQSYDDQTLIVYVTAGHMRRKLLPYFKEGKALPLDFCSVLMVDEIHTGNLDTSMVVYLWQEAANQGVQVPRLVLATATPITLTLNLHIEEIRIQVNNYPVDIIYHGKDYGMDSLEALYSDTANEVARMHTMPGDAGDFMVFVPGSSETETMERLLNGMRQPNLLVLKAHGLLNQEDVRLIYNPAPPGTRKVIICTNIAESSITVSNIGIVFDTLLEKRTEAEHSGLRLVLHNISKSSADQRKGRTGRTRSGLCYRMCSQEFYQELEDHRPPEIQRIPIYEVLMELLSVGLTPAEVLVDVSPQRVNKSIVLLRQLQMVKEQGRAYMATDKGRFTTRFPLNVRNASALYLWKEKGYPLYPGIVALSLIDCFHPSYFWVPRKEAGQNGLAYNNLLAQHREKYFSRFRSSSDLAVFIKMWLTMLEETGGPAASSRDISNWCSKNSINHRKILDVKDIINKCIASFRQLKVSLEIGPFTLEGVLKALTPILSQVYTDLTFTKLGSQTYRSPEGETYTLDMRGSLAEYPPGGPQKLIGLVTVILNTGGRNMNRISASLPI